MNINKIKNSYIYIAILVFLSMMQLVFALRTNSYFSVDDFQVLSYFQNHSVGTMVVNFFLNGDMFSYRKIVGHIIFGSLFKTFGVNQDYYIITLFLVHTFNLILLFGVVRILTKNNFAAFFAGAIYNKFYLFYFSNIHEYIGAFFVLLTILLFLKYPKKVYLAIITYIFALFSKELTFGLPFLVLAISIIRGDKIKRTLPLFVVLGVYAVYQGYFVFVRRASSFGSYGLSFNLSNIYTGLIYYFSPFLISLLALLPIVTKKVKPLYILGVLLITVLPFLFFGGRRENYYLYIPMVYLLIYLSMYLPKLTFKTAAFYLILLLIFGGRSVFPPTARQNFPNWQKVSIENVVNKVEASLISRPETAEISLKEITLERDAKLMLWNGVLGLFVAKNISEQYVFSYNDGTNTVLADRRK